MLLEENYQVINMKNDHYPSGSVRALLQTDLIKPNTHAVLKDRLEKEKIITPVFFDNKNFEILTSVCMRLIPQHDRAEVIDLPGLLDEQLSAGTGKGWRFNQMPNDKIMYSEGLSGIDETSELMYRKEFSLLAEADQDAVLSKVQLGNATGKTWKQMPSRLFFEELLTLLTELYYSHPLAKEEIGEVAFADGKGWQNIGLNEHEAHEPLSMKYTDDK